MRGAFSVFTMKMNTRPMWKYVWKMTRHCYRAGFGAYRGNNGIPASMVSQAIHLHFIRAYTPVTSYERMSIGPHVETLP